MLASSIPTKIVLPFANNAGGSYINVVPVPSQIGITNGAASFYDGFPPNTFVALAAGGAGPFGKDFNGLLNVMSAWERWYCAGGPITYDSTFQGTSQVGGYPSGAIVQSATTFGLIWMSVVDNNTTNPDTGGAGWLSFNRLRLAANKTFYVATTGSDSNTGLTGGSPWLTIQHAIDVLQSTYDLNGHTATISVADGTYAGAIVVGAPFTGGGTVNIVGNVSTPATCIISTTGTAILANNSGVIGVSGVNLATAGTGFCLFATLGGQINVNGPVQFGTCAVSHMYALDGGRINITNAYSITGSPTYYHWCSEDASVINADGVTVTLSGSPAFGNNFAFARSCGVVHCAGMTFTGTGTGSRYNADANGVIQTNGAGSTYLPGNSGGTTTTGGQYV